MKIIGSSLLLWCAFTLLAAAAQPNIILFLADDLGYADIGANGAQDVRTPHIDAIARNGVRFTDGYATHPVCSPSRAGLMSGRYQHRFGFEHNSGPERFAAPNFGQPRDVPTLAEKLKAAGYATGMVGKWHIGFQPGLRPHERGFDCHYGFLSGAHAYRPETSDRNPIVRNGVTVQPAKYLTDAFADEAVEFIGRRAGKPYFLYVAFNAVHSPMEATTGYEDRFPQISDPKRPTYAGMLAALDDAIGRVMSKVRELGQERNTLVMFYSDNGGPTFETTSRNDPLRGYKAQTFEGGIRVPFAMQWPGRIPAGQTYREMVMGFDCHATALAAAGVDLAGAGPLDGVDLLPFLSGGKPGRPHDRLFWRAGAQHAVRLGEWKLVTPRGEPTMLFHLGRDIGERDNLADREPGKVKELQAAFAEWEKGMQPAKWIRQDASNAEPGGARRTGAAGGRAGSGSRKGVARLEAAFEAADRDRDGKLSRAEYPQPALFDGIDTDRDGFATLAEVRAYYASRRNSPAP